MSEVAIGNLYEMNKSIMKDQPAMKEEDLAQKLQEVAEYFKTNEMFHMLLCHDNRDYTIFLVRNKDFDECIDEAVAALKDCMLNRGKVLDITLQPDGAYEIWLKIDNEPYAYYLFPYDNAIIIC